MAIYPRARVRLLPESGTQPAITPTQVIAHTAVDGLNTTSLYDWFANGTNLEAHFYVAKDGTVEQYMDTEVRADANNKANGRAVSIETWDGRALGGGKVAPPNRWTPAQAAALTDLIGWLCDTHGIPRRVAPAWDAPGVGWHNLYPQWSPGATGCPGPPRAEQLRDEIIPALAAHRPATAPPTDVPAAGRKDTSMFTVTNADGLTFIVRINDAGQVVSSWRENGRRTPWAELVPGIKAKNLGQPLVSGPAVWVPVIASTEYGEVPLTLVQSSPGGLFEAHGSDALADALAGLAGKG